MISKPTHAGDELSVGQFVQLRNVSWDANAALWSNKLGTDTFRAAIFDAALGEIEARVKAGKDACTTLADIGCGDGAFLDKATIRFPKMRFFGIDICRAFTDQAQKSLRVRNINADIEVRCAELPRGVDIAVSLLSLIEMVDIKAALANVHSMLRQRALFLLVILDSSAEIRRFRTGRDQHTQSKIFRVGCELVISSHFKVDAMWSPAPYFRFLRSNSRYRYALLKQGFDIERIYRVYPMGAAGPQGVIFIAWS